MFLACLRTALSQSTRLASMRSVYVVSGKLSVHARSLSGVARWRTPAWLAHTTNYQNTATQWQRHVHTPGNRRVIFVL